MKIFFIFFVLLAVSCSTKSKKINCDRFHAGNFRLTIEQEGVTFDIKRTESSQMEYDRNTDTITGYKIKWTDECEYELVKTYKRKMAIEDSSQPVKIFEFRNSEPLKVKIITTGDTYYVFEAWKESVDFVFKDTIWLEKIAGPVFSIGEKYQ